jgi:CRP/FNR family cyclic AMP-dependent transcriptional regulator
LVIFNAAVALFRRLYESQGDRYDIGHIFGVSCRLAITSDSDLVSVGSMQEDPIVTGSPRGRSAILPRLPEHLSRLLFASAQPRHLEASEVLFAAGDTGDGCYRLERGLLKVVISSPQGDERILAILSPGSIAGELAVIDGRPRSASVVAVRACELSFVSHALFEECTQQHPEIYRYLVNVLAARLREADDALAATSFMTVKARLARTLLELGDLLGEKDASGHVVIRHQIHQDDLAAMAGVARDNVSRVISDWKRRKVITRSSGYYCLGDITVLKQSVDS